MTNDASTYFSASIFCPLLLRVLSNKHINHKHPFSGQCLKVSARVAVEWQWSFCKYCKCSLTSSGDNKEMGKGCWRNI